MKYYKIKVELKEYKNRLNRVLYVKEDISLIELGTVIINSLGGTFEHFFLFDKDEVQYVPAVFMENSFKFMEQHPLVDYKMVDIGKKFSFMYDTGDGWYFDVIVSDELIEFSNEEDEDNPPLCYIESGVGQGIWEDNIASLYGYLDGELDDDDQENEEEGIYFPWNFEITKFSDFDNPIDLEEIQCDIDNSPMDLGILLQKDGGYTYEGKLDYDSPIEEERIEDIISPEDYVDFTDLDSVSREYNRVAKIKGEDFAYDYLLKCFVIDVIADLELKDDNDDKEKLLEFIKEYNKRKVS